MPHPQIVMTKLSWVQIESHSLYALETFRWLGRRVVDGEEYVVCYRQISARGGEGVSRRESKGYKLEAWTLTTAVTKSSCLSSLRVAFIFHRDPYTRSIPNRWERSRGCHPTDFLSTSHAVDPEPILQREQRCLPSHASCTIRS